jgi:formylglycine-generating enzyme required for sulfatase activity
MRRLILSTAVIACALSVTGMKTAGGAEPEALQPGSVFRDCERRCPEMVVIPAGSFRIGSAPGEAGSLRRERPQRDITIARPLAVGRYEVTFDEWDACVRARGCRGRRERAGRDNNISVASDEGWGRGRRPVINVSPNDAQMYVTWLSQQTGQTYRLLSEAEWEYAARAGTTTPYVTGDEISPQHANFQDSGHARTLPVGSYPANPFGLFDMQGNVYEITQDCFAEGYFDLPLNGSALRPPSCGNRSVRGGSWSDPMTGLRSAARSTGGAGFHGGDKFTGFRVARQL